MKGTSSRSVKGIPRMALDEADSGIPPIDPTSATTFEGSTAWTIKLLSGETYVVRIPGDGRISYGRSMHRDGAEVRFYRNQTTKTYDAVIPNVVMVVSNRVTIEKPTLSAEEAAAEKAKEEAQKAAEKEHAELVVKSLTEAIVRRDYVEPEEF